MAFYTESKIDLLAVVNATNSLTLKMAEVVFSAPKPTNGSWLGNTTSKNSVVLITPEVGSPYQGNVTVMYDRLNLVELSHIQGFKLSADKPQSTHALLGAIQYYAGMTITADDIEDTPLVDNGNGTYSGTLIAKANSLGWFGSVPVTVKQGGARLDTIISDPALDGLNYPTANATDIFGNLYLYPYDFSDYQQELDDLVDGAALTGPQVTAMVAMLKAKDISSGAALWNEDAGSTTWSLAGAKCVTNGLNGADMPTNPLYKYVLVLQLRAGVTTPAGNLYLHYNDKLDTSVV